MVSYFRPSNIDGAQHAWTILALVVNRLRRAWPQVRIIRRADSGVCRWRLLSWCERHGVQSLIGLAKNARVNRVAEPSLAQAAPAFADPAQSQRCFAETEYGAESWDRSRPVLSKAEHTVQGAHPRAVVTTLRGEPQYLYARVYCPRGAMENRIKEQQLDWFAARTSCHRWWPNQFRRLLASLSYVLLEAIRRLGLAGTAVAQAQVGTLRLKLLKIGAVILRNPRRGRFLLSRAYPYQALFRQAVARLASG